MTRDITLEARKVAFRKESAVDEIREKLTTLLTEAGVSTDQLVNYVGHVEEVGSPGSLLSETLTKVIDKIRQQGPQLCISLQGVTVTTSSDMGKIYDSLRARLTSIITDVGTQGSDDKDRIQDAAVYIRMVLLMLFAKASSTTPGDIEANGKLKIFDLISDLVHFFIARKSAVIVENKLKFWKDDDEKFHMFCIIEMPWFVEALESQILLQQTLVSHVTTIHSLQKSLLELKHYAMACIMASLDPETSLEEGDTLKPSYIDSSYTTATKLPDDNLTKMSDADFNVVIGYLKKPKKLKDSACLNIADSNDSNDLSHLVDQLNTSPLQSVLDLIYEAYSAEEPAKGLEEVKQFLGMKSRSLLITEEYRCLFLMAFFLKQELTLLMEYTGALLAGFDARGWCALAQYVHQCNPLQDRVKILLAFLRVISAELAYLQTEAELTSKKRKAITSMYSCFKPLRGLNYDLASIPMKISALASVAQSVAVNKGLAEVDRKIIDTAIAAGIPVVDQGVEQRVLEGGGFAMDREATNGEGGSLAKSGGSVNKVKSRVEDIAAGGAASQEPQKNVAMFGKNPRGVDDAINEVENRIKLVRQYVKEVKDQSIYCLTDNSVELRVRTAPSKNQAGTNKFLVHIVLTLVCSKELVKKLENKSYGKSLRLPLYKYEEVEKVAKVKGEEVSRCFKITLGNASVNIGPILGDKPVNKVQTFYVDKNKAQELVEEACSLKGSASIFDNTGYCIGKFQEKFGLPVGIVTLDSFRAFLDGQHVVAATDLKPEEMSKKDGDLKANKLELIKLRHLLSLKDKPETDDWSEFFTSILKNGRIDMLACFLELFECKELDIEKFKAAILGNETKEESLFHKLTKIVTYPLSKDGLILMRFVADLLKTMCFDGGKGETGSNQTDIQDCFIHAFIQSEVGDQKLLEILKEFSTENGFAAVINFKQLDPKGKCALLCACESKYSETVGFLLGKQGLNAKGFNILLGKHLPIMNAEQSANSKEDVRLSLVNFLFELSMSESEWIDSEKQKVIEWVFAEKTIKEMWCNLSMECKFAVIDDITTKLKGELTEKDLLPKTFERLTCELGNFLTEDNDARWDKLLSGGAENNPVNKFINGLKDKCNKSAEPESASASTSASMGS